MRKSCTCHRDSSTGWLRHRFDWTRFAADLAKQQTNRKSFDSWHSSLGSNHNSKNNNNKNKENQDKTRVRHLQFSTANLKGSALLSSSQSPSLSISLSLLLMFALLHSLILPTTSFLSMSPPLCVLPLRNSNWNLLLICPQLCLGLYVPVFVSVCGCLCVITENRTRFCLQLNSFLGGPKRISKFN